MANPFRVLSKLDPKPQTIPVSQLKGKLSEEDIRIITRLGITLGELSKKVEQETTINYDRSRFYTEVTKALEHWFVGPALGLYADYATSFNHLHNASVWITSKSPKYQKELSKLLERIGIEEKILDWGWTVGGYGDLFVEVKGEPGLGVVSINDDEHPLNVSRIDHEGCLIGFFRTPQGNSMNGDPQDVIPPWDWVHARLLGAKRKRSVFSDPTLAEFRTMHMMTGIDTRQISSRYGTCIPRAISIETDSGTYTVGEIVDKKLQVNVKSFNVNTGEIEYKPIINWFRRSNKDGLIRIKFNSKNTGKQILCTPDHLILTANREWVKAKDLTLNDQLMVESADLTEEQKQILIGGILSDGSFGNKHLTTLNDYQCGDYRFTQSLIHKTFFDWTLKNLSNLEPATRLRYRKSPHGEKLHGTQTLQTRKCMGFEEIYKNSYKGGKKCVTKELLDNITSLGLAVWMMGDGSFGLTGGHNGKYKYIQSTICTDSFTKEEHELIVKWLKEKFDIDSRIARPPSYQKYRIRIGIRSTRKLLEIIKDYLILEGTKKLWIAKDIEISNKIVTVPTNICGVAVYNNKRARSEEEVFDIEVQDNHNFLVSGAVIHNSLLVDALPTYKRLRLAEDSLLMARLTRGILRYVWKLRVTSQNAEATEALMSQLTGLLKKARALDISAGSPNFDSKFSVLANNEDLIIPVWGDSASDLMCDKIGGDVDIRWIVDVEELRQQLACTLRVPLSLLGGYVKEATGSLGSDAIEKLDIGFARSARRLQRAIKQAIKRICQIHLAYMNMDPDPALFDVCMNESSTAEEESARDSLDKGLDAVNKMLETIESADPEKTIDRKKVVDYLNKKILKLDDFSLDNFLLEANVKLPANETINENKLTEDELEIQAIRDRAVTNNDLSAYLPLNETSNFGKFFDERHLKQWEDKFKKVKIGTTEDFASMKEPKLKFKD